MNSISPIKRVGQDKNLETLRVSSTKDIVPIFEASLFKSFDQKLSNNTHNKSQSRNNQSTLII